MRPSPAPLPKRRSIATSKARSAPNLKVFSCKLSTISETQITVRMDSSRISRERSRVSMDIPRKPVPVNTSRRLMDTPRNPESRVQERRQEEAKMDEPLTNIDARPTKRLSRKLTKRFSAPVPLSKKEGKRSSIASTFSLPSFSRSSSAPETTTSTALPTSTLPTNNSTSTGSTPSLRKSTSNASHRSTTTLTISTAPIPSSGIPPPYDPLQNYIPCLHPTCRTHYLPTLLGPTFYSPQVPYQLSRKYGLCVSHARKDLYQANAICKAEYERMRQQAGRKTLRVIAAEFDVWVQQFKETRHEQSRANVERMKLRVLGPNASKAAKSEEEGKEHWDWRYVLRPCTRKSCTQEWYSLFSTTHHLWYATPRKSGVHVAHHLCPTCARLDIDSTERQRDEKWDEVHPQQWREWLERLIRYREAEQDFWVLAQEKRVREHVARFPARAEVERRSEEVGKTVDGDGDGKGKDELKELCVVM